MAKRKPRFEEAFLEFREAFNERAESWGCSRMPKRPSYHGMYWKARKLVKEFEEPWPTWEEIDAGIEAMSNFSTPFTLPTPGWLFGYTKDEEYPNILRCRNHGRKARLQGGREIDDIFIGDD
jgi:hypothetical protein